MVEIRVGYELIYDCPQPTPMMLVLNIHYTRASDLAVPDHVITEPSIPIAAYRDSFGNWCSRIVAPKGRSGYRAPRSSRTRVSRTSLQLLRSSIRYKICLKKPSFFSWGADTAIQNSFPRPLGACSVKRRRAGAGPRRSAISCTNTSHSVMSMPAPQGQPGKRSTSGAGSAAITHILLLPFADA